MLAEERFALILDLLARQRTATVQELCEALNASESTIRRDLNELDKQGKLNKVHGGATLPDSPFRTDEPTMAAKEELAVSQKQSIAQAAAELADRPILPYLEWILLQFMDGSAHPVGRDSAVYRLVLSVIEIPAHLLPGNMDMKKLIFACDAILTGGVGDHQQSIL